jgi:uncharacterized protein (DUF2147 family)
MKKLFSFLIFILFFSLSSFQPGHEAILGEWFNTEKDATILFYECGGKLCGKVHWMKEPNENGKPKVDKNNPDPAKRNTPAMGMVIMQGFEKTKDNFWENGTIYDPNNGKTYKSHITLVNSNQLNVRGFIGFSLLGRTENWTRKR